MSGKCAYDIVVVGAGPAGLSAARTTARLGFKTLVLERLAGPGQPGHPCSGIIAPVPHQSANNRSGDLYFRKLDLAIPASMVIGYPSQQHWLSPNGFVYRTGLSGHPERPAAAIDKPALLNLLAERAEQTGAELRFGTTVTGLLQTNGRVTGVRTSDGEVPAQIVLSAEGVTREICRTALPVAHAAGPERYGLIAYQELDAPAIGTAQVGQFITLGRRYTSARTSFGMLVAPVPGRLWVYFCLFADGAHHFTERSARFYLQEYMSDDPRVRDLCACARPLGEMVSQTLAASAPARVTAAGFMGLGDAITPAGYLGILPAVYLGRQAALVAAGALDAGDCSAARLAHYEQVFRRRMLPDLNAESRILTRLADMPDSDLDAFCCSLGSHRLALPFSAHARAIEWATVGSGERGHQLALPHQPRPAPELAWRAMA